MSWHLHHVTPAIASERSSTSPRPRRVSELEIADHPISLHVEQRRSVPIQPELARDPVPKPRSRRCFVCGTTGRHPLDFRLCPRTSVLLRRRLAKINEDGCLVAFDGSPLPLTRHPGGVAAHLLSHIRNPACIVSEPRESPPAPCIARVPPCHAPAAPRDHVASPPPTFHSSSPHAIPPVVPSWLLVFLESLLDGVIRAQLRVIVSAIERLGVQDSSTLRQRLQPVFERISLPLL
ncbi:hypothetical protein B0H10DRAFT_2101987 [Mycena sp. CBHHK59/15]|nr:hypothetical protein B0H10DRAFT_2101987 [Mycena sp. CBHHK59/15]